MPVFNFYGFLFMAVIMVPNIVFAVRNKDGFQNLWHNRAVEFLEQIGRFACFGFMLFNIPHTCFGFPSDKAFAAYIIVNCMLTAAYCLIWIVCFRKSSVFRALALSILPSLTFLCSGIFSRSVLLIAASLVFAPCHITVSYKMPHLPQRRKNYEKNRFGRWAGPCFYRCIL